MSFLSAVAAALQENFVEAKVVSKEALVEVYDSTGKLIKNKVFISKYLKFLERNPEITPVNIYVKGFPRKTTMFFPFGAQAKRLITPKGKHITKDALWKLMRKTKGGIPVVRAFGGEMQKGYALCRKCGKPNGCGTATKMGHAIPTGAFHYIKDHKIPANLFSVNIEGNAIFYVASSPAKLK